MGRREREWEFRKREILDAALRLFSRKGFFGASMREIAEEAEFAVGTLYRFFPTKRTLYEELVKEHALAIHEEMMEVFSGKDSPCERFLRWFHKKWEVSEKYRDFLRLYFSELWESRFSLSGTLSADLKAMYENYMQALTHLLAECVSCGCVRGGDPELYALAVEGLVNNLISASLQGELDVDPEDVLEGLIKPLLGVRSC